jgi:hypothetical protein
MVHSLSRLRTQKNRKMHIRFLTPDDAAAFAALISIFNTAFEHEEPMPDAAYLKTVLETPSFAAVAAFMDGDVVGGLTVYELKPYYSKKPQVYIYDVGVAPAWRDASHGCWWKPAGLVPSKSTDTARPVRSNTVSFTWLAEGSGLFVVSTAIQPSQSVPIYFSSMRPTTILL